MSNVTQILKKHHLKNTKLRLAVLEALNEANSGLNHQELSKRIDIDFDRVSLFRTLSQFEEVGIVHKILDLAGVAHYALNPIANGQEQHKCLTHFICTDCERIQCIDEPLPEQQWNIPAHLQVHEIEITYKGHCELCKPN